MITTRGMGQHCGIASYGMGQFVTVVVVLPDRVFVHALSVLPGMSATQDSPEILVLVAYPFFSAVLAFPSIAAVSMESEMSATTRQPDMTGVIGQPRMSAVVIRPEQEGSGS